MASIVTEISNRLTADVESVQAAVVALLTVTSVCASFYVVKKFLKNVEGESHASAKGTVVDDQGNRRSTRQPKTPQRFDPTKEAQKPQLVSATPEKEKKAPAATPEGGRTPRGRRAAAPATTPKAKDGAKTPRTATKKKTPRGKAQ